MLEGGIPYPVVASIMGWSAATAIRMAKRYGHIGQRAYQQAVSLLNGSLNEGVLDSQKSASLLQDSIQ